nr:hypothetical protein [Burkholderiaceae bacterium]
NHLISEELPGRLSNSDPITGQAAWYDVRVRISAAQSDEAAMTWPQTKAVPQAPGTGIAPRWRAFFAGQGAKK